MSAEEFEKIFGNIPFGDIKKIQEYIDINYISKQEIKEIRDKAEVMDYYVLSDVIEDLNKLLEK